MSYKNLGLVNTTEMFKTAALCGYAVPAFNFNNMEQLQAIMDAARATASPVILQASESAIKYMGRDMLTAMVGAAVKSANNIPVCLNLDHGRDFEICADAIKIGFSNVMIDASDKSFDDNVVISRRVAEYAHKYGVTVEAELGSLDGIEEGAPTADSKKIRFTNPAESKKFVDSTGIDSLAVSVGTSHGAYKMKDENCELRFDILEKIASLLPRFPLVLHGASSVPQRLVNEINSHGGKIQNAKGIPVAQIRRAVGMNICKINIDSDGRLAFTAAVRKALSDNPSDFDPRKYLSLARTEMRSLYIHEIENIMGSGKF